MIYGNPKPRLDGVSFDRSGLAKLSTSRPWQPSRTGLSIRELLAEIPLGQEVSGLEIIGSETRLENGVLRSSWNYEGPGSATPENPATVESGFEPEWAERSLLLHPNWFKFEKDYGGYVDQGTGRIIWPEWMPNNGYSGGLSGGKGDAWKSNPMYGRQTYEDLVGGIWSYAYITNSLEKALSRIGDIFEASEVPGEAPNFPNRNYLKPAPKYDKIGAGYKVIERYKLSDVGGWLAKIYKNWSEE